MKRTVFTFIMMAALSLSVCGQGTNRKILRELADSDDVERISVGSFGMWLVKLIGGKEIPEIKGINSVEIMTISDKCPPKRREALRKQIAKLSDDSEYETLMQVKEEGNKVRMLIRQEDDVVREWLLAVVSNDDDSVVIRIKGKMKLSDIQEMVEKGNIKIN